MNILKRHILFSLAMAAFSGSVAAGPGAGAGGGTAGLAAAVAAGAASGRGGSSQPRPATKIESPAKRPALASQVNMGPTVAKRERKVQRATPARVAATGPR